jgi:hypothetical protein
VLGEIGRGGEHRDAEARREDTQREEREEREKRVLGSRGCIGVLRTNG